MKTNGWGSENLKREISECKIGVNEAVIRFKNGSWIKVVTASDNGRGKRANIVIIDEFRMVDKGTIDTVLRRFCSNPRLPRYLSNPKYEHLKERNKEIYMSSAWYANHWSYQKAKSFFANMLDYKKKYFICSLPYQVSIKEGLLDPEQIADEMSESDFDEVKWSMEMEAMFWGDSDGSFFTFDDVFERRKLKYPMYPSDMIQNKTYKIPDLAYNERRILSVDVALMASNKHNNDASAIIINSALPTGNESYVANIVWLENHEGLNTDELALIVRRLYDKYKCTDLVIDTSGSGLGVYDKLVQDIVDPETGELYHALSCCNDENMADRCKVASAPKEIWSIKGSSAFNSEICIALRNGFKNNKINLLIPEEGCESNIKTKYKNFAKMTTAEQFEYKMPYIQTGLLVTELVKLEYEVKNGTNIKIKERTGMRKDRYSSLAYNYWVQCQLEREILRKPKAEFNIKDYAKGIRKLNHKPISY